MNEDNRMNAINLCQPHARSRLATSQPSTAHEKCEELLDRAQEYLDLRAVFVRWLKARSFGPLAEVLAGLLDEMFDQMSPGEKSRVCRESPNALTAKAMLKYSTCAAPY